MAAKNKRGRQALCIEERRKLQNRALKLPLLPTTTIGSFPQTAEVKKLRRLLNQVKSILQSIPAQLIGKLQR